VSARARRGYFFDRATTPPRPPDSPGICPAPGGHRLSLPGSQCRGASRVTLPQAMRRRGNFGIPVWSMFRRRKPTIAPCLPRPAKEPPSGADWIHEIKHDGFRILARRDKERVRLFTRNGYDFTARFPKIAAAVENLGVCSCVLDFEAVVVDERGLSVFNVLRCRLRDHAAVLCAFNLIELDGEDLRWQPLEHRKATLANLLRGVHDGVVFNQHFTGDGAIIFRHACALGCEGIVSKRLGSHYRSGRVDHWLKIKKPGGSSGEARDRRRLGRQAMGARSAF
jgi:bifunctional non-homologous end joining protein LigD